MKKLIVRGASALTVLALALLWVGCNNPATEVENPVVPPADEPYEVDIAGTNRSGEKGAVLWDSDTSVDDDGNITFPTSLSSAWGVNLYTEDTAGMDLSGYGSILIDWEPTFPAAASEENDKQMKFSILCGGTNPDNNTKLESYITWSSNDATQRTSAISLAVTDDFTLVDKQNVQQLVVQAKTGGTTLKVHSITIMPLTDGFTVKDIVSAPKYADNFELLDEFEGKKNVVKISTPSDWANESDYSGWAALRVVLGEEYYGKKVQVTVSADMYADNTTGKIMWQINAGSGNGNSNGYPNVAGGNDSYAVGEWFAIGGASESQSMYLNEPSGILAIYLNNDSLQAATTYYVANFKATVDILE
jgi:hypothetical protein